MEPVQGSTSGHTQVVSVLAEVMDLLLALWALTITVSQELILLDGVIFFTLMIHCGMDRTADMKVHAVIPQASHGFARSFLNQLMTPWSFESVGILHAAMRILPLTLFNSTFSDNSNL